MIPIARPDLGEEEAAAARAAILSGWVTQGPRVKQFEEDFADYTGAQYACAVSSCTTALHLALLAVGVRPGDVVITVSHSFIATANCVRYCGAEPVFIDIEPPTFNISGSALERCLREDCETRDGRLYYKRLNCLAKTDSPHTVSLTGRVAAILPVHQMGFPCDMKSVIRLAGEYSLPVVEDAACAIGSEISMDGGNSWKKIGDPAGDVACFSFHPRKVITTGDGGMLTTNNADYDKKFRLLRQHGMEISDTARHVSGKVLFENYNLVGYNYRLTDLQAAIGIEQLKRVPGMIEARRRIASVYGEALRGVEWLSLPVETLYGRANWQSYPIRIIDGAPRTRDDLMQYMLDKGVSTRRGIMNAHQERPYKKCRLDLAESEKARDSVVMLPIFNALARKDVERITELVKNA